MKEYIKYPVYGIFEVTTEGDDEGRSTRHLGSHEGFIDEIALKLADQCYYSLRFKLVESLKNKLKTRDKVNVSLHIDSGTWDMSAHERASYARALFRDRPVTIIEGSSSASFEIVDGNSSEAIEKEKNKLLVVQALAKLTVAERKALGID